MTGLANTSRAYEAMVTLRTNTNTRTSLVLLTDFIQLTKAFSLDDTIS